MSDDARNLARELFESCAAELGDNFRAAPDIRFDISKDGTFLIEIPLPPVRYFVLTMRNLTAEQVDAVRQAIADANAENETVEVPS